MKKFSSFLIRSTNFPSQIDMFRSRRGFFRGGGEGMRILHRGHLGLLFDISTYIRQLGQPVANEAGESSSWSISLSLIEVEEFEEGDDDALEVIDNERFLIVSFSALSRADFTLSRVHTLWYVNDGGEDDADGTSFKSKLPSSKRFNGCLKTGGKLRSSNFVLIWSSVCFGSEDEELKFWELHFCR